MEYVIGHGAVTIGPARGETLSLDDATGVRIASLGGVVWVTQERGDADHFVEPGAYVLVTRAGRTVVEALGAGRVKLSAECACGESQAFERYRNISNMKRIEWAVSDGNGFQVARCTKAFQAQRADLCEDSGGRAIAPVSFATTGLARSEPGRYSTPLAMAGGEIVSSA